MRYRGGPGQYTHPKGQGLLGGEDIDEYSTTAFGILNNFDYKYGMVPCSGRDLTSQCLDIMSATLVIFFFDNLLQLKVG